MANPTFTGNHPRRYAVNPDAYPDCLNDLDFVAVFDPIDERGLTPLSDRWLEVLVFLEAEIRAQHRQLAADREQFNAAQTAETALAATD